MFPPIADPVQFALAAAVVLFPLPLLFGKSVQYRELDRSWEGYLPKAFQLPWHWIDLLRAGLGTWLLMEQLGIGRRLQPPVGKTAVIVLAGILVLAGLVQMLGCKRAHSFHLPIGFVAGLLMPLYPLVVGVLMTIVAMATAVAARSALAYFAMLAFAIPALGGLLYRDWLLLGVGVAVALVPLLLPLLFEKETVIAHRAMVESDLPSRR